MVKYSGNRLGAAKGGTRMNRLVMMVLKNLHIVPGAFIKLWRYAAKPEKYKEIEMWNHILYMMGRAVKAGNIDLKVTGLENLPEGANKIRNKKS